MLTVCAICAEGYSGLDTAGEIHALHFDADLEVCIYLYCASLISAMIPSFSDLLVYNRFILYSKMVLGAHPRIFLVNV
jgi:hypothetical protein